MLIIGGATLTFDVRLVKLNDAVWSDEVSLNRYKQLAQREKLYAIHTYPTYSDAQQKGFGLGGNLQAGGV